MNADDVRQLRDFYEQDIVDLHQRLRTLLAKCTHARADGSSAAEHGVCRSCNRRVDAAPVETEAF